MALSCRFSALASVAAGPPASAIATGISVAPGQTDADPAPGTFGEAHVLERVKTFRPYHLRNGCVPNSLIFEDWFARRFPRNWRSQEVIEHRDTQGVLNYHRVVLFEAGAHYYVYDQSGGALRIPGHATPANRREMAANASKLVGKLLAQDRPGTTPRRHGFLKDSYRLLFEEMEGHRPVAIVSYHGNDVLVFRERPWDGLRTSWLVSVWSHQTGTRSARVSPEGAPEQAVSLLLQSFWRGDGIYQTTAGEIGAPGSWAQITAGPTAVPASAPSTLIR